MSAAAHARAATAKDTGQARAAESNWLVRFPNLAPAARLFCFPFAGGGASAYYAWRRHLPPEIELCAVQLPGRETLADMRPLRTIAEIVAALVPRISAELGLPYAFFGHSMGAFVCFEVARTLAQLGLPPPTLCVVSARRAPQLPQRAPLHALPERELVREIRAFGGTPEEVLADRELMARLLPLLRADLEATESYRFRPGNPLSSPLLALGGANDGSVDLNGLEAWHPHTTSEFQMRIFEGGHFFIKTAQASVLSTIAQQLSAHSAT